LGGAFLLNALLRINTEGNSVGFFDCLIALVVNDALEVVRGILISSSGEAVVPAGEVGIALSITLIQNVDTSSVVGAGLLLLLAVFQDAVVRVAENGDSCGLVTSI